MLVEVKSILGGALLGEGAFALNQIEGDASWRSLRADFMLITGFSSEKKKCLKDTFAAG
jgi:hypothetical protein